MIDRQTVRLAALRNAELLGIKMPVVEYLPAAAFGTATTRAAASTDGSSIAVNVDMQWTELDIWWAVSHEMRHIWQIQSGIDFAQYRASDGDPAVYNSQPEEIDAHAWAQAMMVSHFCVKPQLDAVLPEPLVRMIDARAKQITEEFHRKS